MSHRQVLHSSCLSDIAYLELCKHLHYEYLYLNLIKKTALQWTTIKLNSWESEIIQKSVPFIDQRIINYSSSSPPLFLRSKLISINFHSHLHSTNR